MRNKLYKKLLTICISSLIILSANGLISADETENTDVEIHIETNVPNEEMEEFITEEQGNIETDDLESTDFSESYDESEGALTSEYEETVEEFVLSDVASNSPATDECVAINETNFPDVNFRSYISTSIDTDSDGRLSPSEISAVTVINCDSNDISTLTGIEFFTSLECLDCSHNQLNSLDVSHNTSLITLKCDNNQLQNLDLSYNTDLGVLCCNDNQIVSLDVINCHQLNEVSCEHNMLDSILFFTNSPIAVNYRLLGTTSAPPEAYPGVLYEYDVYYSDDLNGITYCTHLHTYYCTNAIALHGKFPSYHCFLSFDTGTSIELDYASAPVGCVNMYRLYNPNNGEHFYTSNSGERDYLISLGWNDEGIGWIAPITSNTPVYRLYNQYGGEHHYTTSTVERDTLITLGWNNEGIGWYSDDAHRVPLYRQYNPNAYANNHNYTTSLDENGWLVSLGWQAEGIGWYGVG